MRKLLAVLLLLVAACTATGPAYAQTCTYTDGLNRPRTCGLPFDPALDPSQIVKDEVSRAIVEATPAPCAVPLPDTLNGSAGTGQTCMPRTDASRPTVIQAKTTVTAADASWEVTWDRPFDSDPIWFDARVYGTTDPYFCTIPTATRHKASGKCYKIVATTLPSLATAIAGAVVSPIAAAGAGLSVRVVARQ